MNLFLLHLTGLLLLIFPALAMAYPAKVLWVADGDTLTVSAQGRTEKIRLYGIDCPEKLQPFGKEVTKFTRSLQHALVDVQPVGEADHYGRTVALVKRASGESVQAWLLHAGGAWVSPQFCKAFVCTAWKSLETQARTKRIGLWADTNPLPPWEWRKLNHTTHGMRRN